MDRPWQFVNNEGSTKPNDAQSRRLVRQNAMRSFRRNQRIQTVKAFQALQAQSHHSSAAPVLEAQEPGKEPSAVTSKRSVPMLDASGPAFPEIDLPIETITSLEIGAPLSFDPFHSTALGVNRNNARLLSHCTAVGKSLMACMLTVH